MTTRRLLAINAAASLGAISQTTSNAIAAAIAANAARRAHRAQAGGSIEIPDRAETVEIAHDELGVKTVTVDGFEMIRPARAIRRFYSRPADVSAFMPPSF